MTRRDLVRADIEGLKGGMLALLHNASMYAKPEEAVEDFWALVNEYAECDKTLNGPDMDDPVRTLEECGSFKEAIRLARQDAALKRLFSTSRNYSGALGGADPGDEHDNQGIS